MRLPEPQARANVSSSSSESDFGIFPGSAARTNQSNETKDAIGTRRDQERVAFGQLRGPQEFKVPLHVGICRNCRRLYKRREVW